MIWSCPTLLSWILGERLRLSGLGGAFVSMLGSLQSSVFRASESLLMVTPSSSHWLSLLLRNNSRAFIPRKLLELGSEPTVSGTVVEGSSNTDVSQRLLNLWFWGFSGVESSLLLPPLLLLLPRVLGGLVSPFLPIVSSLYPATVSSLPQSSLFWEQRGYGVKEMAATVYNGQGNAGEGRLLWFLSISATADVLQQFSFQFCNKAEVTEGKPEKCQCSALQHPVL